MSENENTSRRLPPRRRYHFHTPGVLYVTVTFFLAIGAINSQNNLLFASLGLAIGGLLVSGLLSGATLMGIRLERAPMESMHVGQRAVIGYRVRNVNRRIPGFGLSISELPAARGEVSWPRLLGRVRAFAAHVPGRGLTDVHVTVQPRRRGLLTFDSVRVWTTFPFGLAKKSMTFSVPASAVVHPVELPVRPGILEKLTVRSLSGVGAAVAPGFGDEFYGLREYADGDNPRWIAWRRSARTGQLVVRQNTTPTPRLLWLVLRLPEGTQEREVERAIALTSALARASAKEGAAVGLAVPSHGLVIPPRSASRAVRGILDRLALLEPADRAGDGAFPALAVRGGANAVIHAGAVDRSFGTGRTRHIGVEDMTDVLVPGDGLKRALALLDAPLVEGDELSRRGVLTRVWRRVAALTRTGEQA